MEENVGREEREQKKRERVELSNKKKKKKSLEVGWKFDCGERNTATDMQFKDTGITMVRLWEEGTVGLRYSQAQ